MKLPFGFIFRMKNLSLCYEEVRDSPGYFIGDVIIFVFSNGHFPFLDNVFFDAVRHPVEVRGWLICTSHRIPEIIR